MLQPLCHNPKDFSRSVAQKGDRKKKKRPRALKLAGPLFQIISEMKLFNTCQPIIYQILQIQPVDISVLVGVGPVTIAVGRLAVIPAPVRCEK